MRKSSAGVWNAALWTLRWLLIAAIVGAVCGAVGTAFHFALDWASAQFAGRSWLLYALPAAGLVIVLMYKAARLPLSVGTDRVFESARGENSVPLALAPLIFAGTFLTQLCGGSAGREGAALQMGGSLACGVGRLLRLDDRQMRVIEMCGMSALFSALFGTPVAAAFFAIEVVDVGKMHYKALMPCMLSAVTAYVIGALIGVEPTRFVLASIPEQGAVTLLKTLALSVACGLVAILFCKVMHLSHELAGRYLKNESIRVLASSALVIALTLLLGTRDYNGAGMGVIKRMIAGETLPAGWIIKLALTAITLAGGFKGGEIVPAFFVGAAFGGFAGEIIGLAPEISSAIGMVSVFCGVTNAPVASVLIASEMFGGQGLTLFAMASAVSFLVSGKCSLYHSQKFLESKYEDRREETQP